MRFRFNNLSLRAKLVGLFVIISVLPIAGLTVLNTWTGERLLYNNARKSLLIHAKHLADKVDDLNIHLIERTAALAENDLLLTELAEPSHQQAVEKLFRFWQESNPNIDSVSLLDEAGEVLFSLKPAPKFAALNLAEARAGRPSVGEMTLPEQEGNPVLTYYAPVKDQQARIKRILAVQVRAQAIWEVIESYNEVDGLGSFAMLLDEDYLYLACGADRKLVFHPAQELAPAGRAQLATQRGLSPGQDQRLGEVYPLPDIIAAIKRQPERAVFTAAVPINEETNEAALAKLTTKPWQVVVVVPHSSFYQSVHAIIRNSVLAGALVLLIALALGIWLARGITLPLKRLATGVEQLGRGSLDVKVALGSENEIGRLGQLFNEMTTRLQDNVTELEAANDRYRQLADSLELRVEERTQDYRLANQRFIRLALREKLVNELTNAVRSSLDLNTILQTSVREVGLALSVSRCVIRLFQHGRLLPLGQEYRAVGIAPAGTSALSPVSKLACRLGHTTSLNDLAADSMYEPWLAEQCAEATALGIRSIMATPIIYRDETLGVITLHECAHDREWTEDEILLLETVARQIAIAIANAQLFEETTQQAIQIESKNREIEQFVYTVSHDLKAPLVSLQGISQMLLEDYGQLLDADGQRYLNRLQLNASHMEQLIQGLLELSRIGRVNDEVVEVAAAEVVGEVLDQFYFQLNERNVTVKLAEALPQFHCARPRLAQIFSNLIGNAIKFMGPDNPAPLIEIGGRRLGAEVEFYVRDNGVGIDEKYHHKIFGIFQRLQEVKNVDGTGVGLAIVQKIVDKNGGRVWVESTRGQGATFRFTLLDQRSLSEPLAATDKVSVPSPVVSVGSNNQRRAS